MVRTKHTCKIDQMLNYRGVVPIPDFLAELGISPAAFKRDLEYLRELLNAPARWR